MEQESVVYKTLVEAGVTRISHVVCKLRIGPNSSLDTVSVIGLVSLSIAPHIWPRSRIGCAVYSCCAQCQKACRVYEFADRERSNRAVPCSTGHRKTGDPTRAEAIRHCPFEVLTKIGILRRRACVHMAARSSPH